MSEPMMWLLVRGVWETLAMTFVSGFFGFVIGLPVGVLLYVTRPGQIIENAKLYRTLSALVNIFRSIPFIILLVWMIPFTRVIVGTSMKRSGQVGNAVDERRVATLRKALE